MKRYCDSHSANVSFLQQVLEMSSIFPMRLAEEARVCIICRNEFTCRELRQPKKLIKITNEEQEKQIRELILNFFSGEGSLETQTKSGNGFTFFGKEVHRKCLQKAKRKSKKQDDPNTKKKRKRDTEVNFTEVLIFSLNDKSSSFFGLFFELCPFYEQLFSFHLFPFLLFFVVLFISYRRRLNLLWWWW